VLLGKYNSPESKSEYARIIAEHKVAGCASLPGSDAPDLTVNELLVKYLAHAGRYYRDADGRSCKELLCVKDAARSLRQLYGHTLATEFGPLALKAVRAAMVEAGLARSVVNARVNRVRRIWKWAASEELVPLATYQALTTVAGLVRGRCEARETEPIRPVDPADVAATLPYLGPTVAAMVRLQQLTGMRPGEVVRLRADELDRSGPVWRFVPRRHKTAYRGRERTIYVGPAGQKLLAPWLDRAGEGFVFSPAREREDRFARMRTARRSRVQPSQADRRKKRPARQPGERYSPESYCRAIATGIRKANRGRVDLPADFVGPTLPPVRHWHPNQLRHSFATAVRESHGLEAAQVLLGHARADVTQVYAERNGSLAATVASVVG
jgi:integrase